MIVAAWKGDADCVRLSLATGVDPDSRYGPYESETFICVGGGRPMALKRWTALHAAAYGREAKIDMGGRVKIVRLLIEAGADLDADDGHGGTPLEHAVSGGWIRKSEEAEAIALALIEAGANVETRVGIYIDGVGGSSPIHGALWNPTIVKALIDAGADVNARDDAGSTALHHGPVDTEVMRLLLAAGADPNVRSRALDKPIMHYVGADSKPELLRMLLEAGADPHVRSRGLGRTPLHCTVTYERADLARALLDAGARPDFRDEAGNTPLWDAVAIWTAERGMVVSVVSVENTDIVRMLVAAGADPNAKCEDGTTPLDMARDASDPDLLRALGDPPNTRRGADSSD